MMQILIIGILTLLSILAPALLHTNQVEFIVDRFTLGFVDASLFDSALYAAYLTAGILLAILSNKIGKRKVFVLLGSAGAAIFYFLMTVTLDYPLLLLFRFLQGCFTVLCWQTLMTMVLDQSTESNRGRNMGIFGIFLASAMGLGPVFGGILAGIGDLVPYYTAAGLSIVVFLLGIFLLREPHNLISKPILRDNLSIVTKKPRLIIPSVFNFIDRLHIGFILFILPIVLETELGVRPELRGMVLGIFALPFILLQYPIGLLSDKIGRYKLLLVGSLMNTVILALIGFITPLGIVYVIMMFFLLGIGNGITGPPAMALVGDTIEEDENAVGMGFFNLLGNLGIMVGPVIAGFLITYTDVRITFLTAASIEFVSLGGILILIVFIFKEKSRDRKSNNMEI
ncbi:MAG: MFS transporter [Candidatus Hodarchaeales archaeon]|jgi:MFS family permease